MSDITKPMASFKDNPRFKHNPRFFQKSRLLYLTSQSDVDLGQKQWLTIFELNPGSPGRNTNAIY